MSVCKYIHPGGSFKTRRCRNCFNYETGQWHALKKCPYGRRCTFAHSEEELSWTFKNGKATKNATLSHENGNPEDVYGKSSIWTYLVLFDLILFDSSSSKHNEHNEIPAYEVFHLLPACVLKDL